jgi:ribonuclease HI
MWAALVAHIRRGLSDFGSEKGACRSSTRWSPVAHGTIARYSDRARGPVRYFHRPCGGLERHLLNHVEIYTDGACKGNPGPGGWGVRLQSGQHVHELFGGELGTTNNRMELTAVIEGLKALKRPCKVTLYLDSEYVRKGITEWIHGWKAKGWRTAAKQPVKNVELWQALDHVVSTAGHQIEWRWVKGHAGDPGNERADALANQGVDQVLKR